MRLSTFSRRTLTALSVLSLLTISQAQRIVPLDEPVTTATPTTTTPTMPNLPVEAPIATMEPTTMQPITMQPSTEPVTMQPATPSTMEPVSTPVITTPVVTMPEGSHSSTTTTTTTTTHSSYPPVTTANTHTAHNAAQLTPLNNLQLPNSSPLAGSTLDVLGTGTPDTILSTTTDNSLVSYAEENTPAMQHVVAPLTGEERALLEQGQAKARQALTSYNEQKIGLPLWQEAMRLGESAKALNPNHPDVYYFLAEVYSITNYWALAWDNWTQYYAKGGTNTDETQRQVVKVGIELGYIYYDQGYLPEALATFKDVTTYAPNNNRGFVWAARVLYEQGEAAASLPLWERAAELNPDDEGARYYLDLVRLLVGVTIDPEEAFVQGVDAYNRELYTDADIRFREALQGDRENASAWAYLARTAVQLEQLPVAQYAIGRATLFEPNNEEYRIIAEEIQQLLTNQSL